MASSVPILRQIAWLSVVSQVALIAAASVLARSVGVDDPALAGALAYTMLSFALRRAIPRDHRADMALVKQEHFAEAIPHFQKSYQFFIRHRG